MNQSQRTKYHLLWVLAATVNVYKGTPEYNETHRWTHDWTWRMTMGQGTKGFTKFYELTWLLAHSGYKINANITRVRQCILIIGNHVICRDKWAHLHVFWKNFKDFSYLKYLYSNITEHEWVKIFLSTKFTKNILNTSMTCFVHGAFGSVLNPNSISSVTEQ